MGAHTFYVIKGVLGVTGVLLLLFHMNRSWQDFDPQGGIGQKMRFITLFYFAVLITSISYDQVKNAVDTISLRNVGALGGVVLLVVTSIVSLIEANEHRKHRERRRTNGQAD